MGNPYRSGSWLSHGWLVFSSSILAVFFLILLLWSPWQRPGASSTKDLQFFCAAGMTKPVAEILREYHDQFGVNVNVSYDGSGKLLSIIRTVKQGDLYLAADASHMRLAQKEGLVKEVLPVGIIRPVLAVNKKTHQLLMEKGEPVKGLNDLLRNDLQVFLANPELASVGQMGRDLLKPLGLWDKLEKRLRVGNVNHVGTVLEVAQNLATINLSIGIVWDTTAAQWDLHVIPVSQFAKAKEEVQIGILTGSQHPTAALKFARYLTARDRGQNNFQKYHFGPVADADFWEEIPEITLAAGAMLKPGIEKILKDFEQREGARIKTVYGGCGLLVSQMRSLQKGEKIKEFSHFPDAYFACDKPFLDDVQPWFEAGDLIAKNDVVMLVPRGNPKGIRSLADLTNKDLKLGVPHQTNSALGKLVDDLFVKVGLHAQIYAQDWEKRIVHTDAAHDLVNKMTVGALDVAIVYRSNVLSSSPEAQAKLEIVEVKLADALAMQPFAVGKNSRHKYLLRRLLAAITSPESAQHFQALGFHWIYEAK